MKPKIDRKLCKYCDYSDKLKGNKCLSEQLGGKCKFE